VPGKKEGSATITVISASTSKYQEAKAVYVAKTAKGLLSVTANGYTGKYDGEEHGITVEVENAIIKYGTSEGSYTLDESPKYSDVGEYIVYYEIEKAGYNQVRGSKTVVIEQADGKIELEEQSGTVEYNKTIEIKIKENKSNGELKVTSSNKEIAEAEIEDGNLKIKGVKTGKATIIVISKETHNYKEAETKYEVEVTKASNTLKISPTTAKYTYPESGTFEIIENISGGSLSCETNDASIAECEIKGNIVTVVPGKKEGSATITIKSAETENYKAGQVSHVAITAKGTLNSYTVNGYKGIYDGSEHGITVESSDSVIKYGTSEGSYTSDESPKYSDVGEYTVYYEITKEGYNVITGSEKVVITKAEGTITAPTAKDLTYTGSAQELIKAGTSQTGEIQYKIEGGTYSTSIPKATNAGTYKVYYKVVGDKNHEDVTETSISVTIKKATLNYTTAGYEGIYDGSEHGITVEASGATIKYGTSSESYTLTTSPKYSDVGEYTVYYQITREGYNTVSGSETVKITKANNVLKITPTSATYTYPESGTFEITENKSGGSLSCETSDKEVATCSISGTTVTVTPGTTAASATLTIKSAETENYKAGQVAHVAITAKGTLNSYTANGYSGIYDGSEHGITVEASGATIKYGTSSESYTLTTSPKYTDVGTYTVYYQIEKEGYNTVKGSKQVVISKAEGKVTAPTAKTLTYTGSAQTLINAGSSSTGTIQYKVGSTGTYSTDLPSGKDAGTYTVYYKVLASTNYKEVTEKSITVTIDKAVNTLTLSANTGTYTYPTSGTFTITKNTSGGSLSCETSNSAVATCSISGTTVTVTPGTTEGSATLTIKSAETDNYKAGQVSHVAITAKGTIPSVTANGYTGTYDGSEHGITVSTTLSGATIKYGTTSGTYNLTSSPTYKDAGTYTVYYQITKTGYQTVEGSKQVVINKAANPITVTAKTLTYTGSAQSLVTVSGAQGNVCYSTSAAPTSCSTAGSIPTGTNAGTYTVYYYVAGNTNYNAKSGNVSVTIGKKADSITITSKTYTYDGNGKATSASATSGLTPTVTYYSDSSCATKTTTSNATAAGGTPKVVGTYYATASTAGNTNYNTASKSCTKAVVIDKATNTLTLSANTGTYTYPTSGTFTVTKNTSGGSLSCTSSNTSVATCSISGTTVTVTPGTTEGSATITVTSAATTNYNSVSAAHVATTAAGTLSVTATGFNGEYDGAAHGITVTASGATIKYGTTNGTYNLTSSPTYKDVGTYTIYYQVSKTGYNTVTGSKMVVIKDTTAPAAPTIANPTSGNWTNTDFSLTLNASDTASGIAYYQYSYDNSSWTTYANSNTNTFTTTAFAIERNQLAYLRVCDNAGNCSSSSSTYIRIDKTSPNLVLGTSTSTQNVIKIPINTNSDSASGIKSVTCKLGTTSGSYTIIGTINNNVCTTTELAPNTTHYYQVCSTDNAGNIKCVTGSKATTALTISKINSETNLINYSWYNGTITGMTGELITLTSNNNQIFLRTNITSISGITNHKIYGYTNTNRSSTSLQPGIYLIASGELSSWHSGADNQCVTFDNSSTPGTWTKVGCIVSSSYNYLSNVMLAQANGSAVGDMHFTGLYIYDLTSYFGAGNEPSLAWCNKYITG